MSREKPQLIVALDVDTFEQAKLLVDRLKNDVEIFKVGSQLFTTCGQQIVNYLGDAGKKIFLDLKYHDIPNTVANAVRAAAKLGGKNQAVILCTLHICGGRKMLEEAVRAASQTTQNIGVTRIKLVGITVLTSEEKKDNILGLVLERSRLAKEVGLDGVVTSCKEAAAVRESCGEDFVIVTPGIRPAGAAAHDQKRIATPAQAITNGSDFLVVGRPIIESRDPQKAVQDILKEMDQS